MHFTTLGCVIELFLKLNQTLPHPVQCAENTNNRPTAEKTPDSRPAQTRLARRLPKVLKIRLGWMFLGTSALCNSPDENELE